MTAPEPRWEWLSRLAIFAGLFIVLGMGLGLLIALTVPAAGEAGTSALQWWTVAPSLIAAAIASWVLTSRIEGRSITTLGLPADLGGLGQLGRGTLFGLALMGAVLLAFIALGWVTWSATTELGSPIAAAGVLLSLLLPAAFTEELLLRGYPFQVIERRFGALSAILVTSAVFGSLHVFNPGIGPLALVNITLAGVLLGVAYWRTRSLWFATGVHLGWNWIMAVSELSVSGIETRMPGFDPVLSGPAMWTGGGFGPEGGLAVSLVTIAGTALMWRLGRASGSLSDPQTDPTT